ncbi:HET-domain-containing protein [Rhizodiscina lignyota]|uniref:HET-domain-containing protein n=1 Tax=Rhizodiscina lignyota TaxID=1504668 RepID=A0A9P4M2H1_9PEZI|nr:HET-domain-containing protein [Rhizodiscina lignyota]
MAFSIEPPGAIKAWIEDCSNHHEICQRREPFPLPHRVVDVGHREVCLYDTKGGEAQPYAALSHRWHDSKPLQTTKERLSHHQRRLVWGELPIAFQEAIELTRALGIRYLWIDSLCIQQDDTREWMI